MIIMVVRSLSAVLAVATLASTCRAWADPPTLEKLREDLARFYLEPKPHMALAKYHHDKGNRLLAFYVLESARRTRFPQQQFDDAFRAEFIDVEPFDDSKEAEARLLKKLQGNPKNVETLVRIADVYIGRSDWANAKKYLNQAIEIRPDHFKEVAALAEVLRQEKKIEDASKLIDQYLTKYPHSVEAYNQKINEVLRKDPDKAQTLLDEAIKRHPREGTFSTWESCSKTRKT